MPDSTKKIHQWKAFMMRNLELRIIQGVLQLVTISRRPFAGSEPLSCMSQKVVWHNLVYFT
jgi:hypothetical protein